MLTFDVTAIDIVLLIAVLVLFLIFVSQKKNQVRMEPQLPVQDEVQALEEPLAMNPLPMERKAKQNPVGFQKCIHDFGYLRNLPQNTAVPDECFGCPKAMRCLFPSE